MVVVKVLASRLGRAHGIPGAQHLDQQLVTADTAIEDVQSYLKS